VQKINVIQHCRSVCNAQHSFAEEFNFSAARGVQDDLGDNDVIEEDEQAELLDFLVDVGSK